jgi:hypothetical protein
MKSEQQAWEARQFIEVKGRDTGATVCYWSDSEECWVPHYHVEEMPGEPVAEAEKWIEDTDTFIPSELRGKIKVLKKHNPLHRWDYRIETLSKPSAVTDEQEIRALWKRAEFMAEDYFVEEFKRIAARKHSPATQDKK